MKRMTLQEVGRKCKRRDEGPSSLQSIFGSDRKCWSQRLESALGVIVAGFPYHLSPIPAVNFTEAAPSSKKIFSGGIKIYTTHDTFFVTKVRDILKNIRLKHTTTVQSKQWLRGWGTHEILASTAQRFSAPYRIAGFLAKSLTAA